MIQDNDKSCVFCLLSERKVIHHNELAYAIRDTYPVTPLHTLIIPKIHVPYYFNLSRDDAYACHKLLDEAKRAIERIDPSVSGFNIGVNVGATAGQTIFHCHIHLIPRRKGDVSNPRGGVRHLISGKGNKLG
jgi:diadenosine tetraphosphate (Ap4A) HIT family hydrolase